VRGSMEVWWAPLLPASRTDGLFMRCAASGRPWPKQRLHPPVDLVVGRRARCRVLKLLSGEPDRALGGWAQGCRAQVPGRAFYRVRRWIAAIRAGMRHGLHGLAWVGHGRAVASIHGEGLQPLPPWSLVDLICKQGRGDINS
jgi:hypothetical protein